MQHVGNLTERIKGFNANLLPKMVTIKYGFMMENIFRFYRGTCHLFYEDLSQLNKLPASPYGWISGDLHLENFGSYKGDNRLVYFDLNDFDEAILAPVNYELARITTSIFLAFESLKIERKRAMNMAQVFLRSYSKALGNGKPNYIEPHTAKGIVRDFLTTVSAHKQKDILKRKTILRKRKITILLKDAKHLRLNKKLKKELFTHITEWLKTDGESPYNYKPIDAVFRLAGTGSVGLKRYAFLLKSLNNEGEKYILIDMKQAVDSSLAPYSKIPQPVWNSQAERIVKIQHIMQNRPPALFSTTHFKDDAYIIQEMQPTKDSINFNLIRNRYRDMYQVIDDMAMLTASSQLRASGRMGAAVADELISFGDRSDWQQEILNYSLDYAEKIKAYYHEFKDAFRKGAFKNTSLKGKI